jgi:glutamate-1-semialdehyde 2,1-aminomutase
MYQAGTLSGNPLATAAGLSTLRELAAPSAYERLEANTTRLVEGLRQAAKEADVTVTINQVGSMFTVFFQEGPVTGWPTADKSDRQAYGRFFHGLLTRGVYFPPAQFEACFLSLAHGEAEIEKTLAAARGAFADLAAGT